MARTKPPTCTPRPRQPHAAGVFLHRHILTPAGAFILILSVREQILRVLQVEEHWPGSRDQQYGGVRDWAVQPADGLQRVTDLTQWLVPAEPFLCAVPMPVGHPDGARHAASRQVSPALTNGSARGRPIAASPARQDQSISGTAPLRLSGYREAIAAHGLAEITASVERYHRAEGASAMARLLDAPSPPDAVFCFNDLLALGALRTVLASGQRVPEDVVVGRRGDQGP
ncbi:LacI family transcriptional regulator [Nonomuraea zeae]|uniref:LacI family transcriptional regulator n=3 Tax=Nonomuraea zeae TaxID=1642303 RepID=A0A5S4GSC7_9ACTN|nr:LacI family transcriptional regulator [Nonomuraea zeae]